MTSNWRRQVLVSLSFESCPWDKLMCSGSDIKTLSRRKSSQCKSVFVSEQRVCHTLSTDRGVWWWCNESAAHHRILRRIRKYSNRHLWWWLHHIDQHFKKRCESLTSVSQRSLVKFRIPQKWKLKRFFVRFCGSNSPVITSKLFLNLCQARLVVYAKEYWHYKCHDTVKCVY